MKQRVAFVVQRYGLEVNGGAEYHCRLIAELLADEFDVDILTTKALDYMTWEDFYETDIEIINNVTVRRFSSKTRDVKRFNQFSEKLFRDVETSTFFSEMEWIRLQGPECNDLLDFLGKHKNEYSAIFFFTYLYYTTFFGLQVVPEKAVLIPTAHDEPPIYLKSYKSLFYLPRFILYNTHEEKQLIDRISPQSNRSSEIVGVGAYTPQVELSYHEFLEKYHIESPYIVYVGRIDESKGCKEMFEFFLKYKVERKTKVKLLLIGKSVMDIPVHPDIVSLGFVSEEDKFAAISNAECLVMPSKYESLSMVVLESFLMKKTVLVNGHCDVLRGHCERGNSGLFYTDYEEFKACLELLIQEPALSSRLGVNGYKYATQNYDWNVIKEKYVHVIEVVSREKV
ncbi:glycosyltransferase family 4 protein [Paenibacillus hodogayensis]|uniref:Glycosyltransferase family 4 protein n=1 Tax=Paenibacillus hodogayensis TaxID=279208 RepID=A0ABV5VS05_9BACL